MPILLVEDRTAQPETKDSALCSSAMPQPRALQVPLWEGFLGGRPHAER